MKVTKFTLTLALLLVALASVSFADPWYQEFRPVAGSDGTWLISPGDSGETIAFQARVYEGFQDPVDTNMLTSASCTITFNDQQVACGGLTTLTVGAVDATVPADGWWTFEIDQPMSLHVDAGGTLGIDVGITFDVYSPPPFGTFPTTDHQNYEAVVFCPDYNADLVVDLGDVSLFATGFYGGDNRFDLNGDGVMNLNDVTYLAGAIGDACGGGAKSALTEADVLEYMKAQGGHEESTWSELKATYR